MRAARVPEAAGDFELVDQPVPTPSDDGVRVRVEACGICHSDAFVKEDTLGFSAPTGIVPEIETFPLEEAAAAWRRSFLSRWGW